MKITIKVTRAMIKKGKRGSRTSCPIALACIKVGLPNPRIGSITVRFDNPNDNYSHVTKRMEKFIMDFDNDVPVKPASFTLYFPFITKQSLKP